MSKKIQFLTHYAGYLLSISSALSPHNCSLHFSTTFVMKLCRISCEIQFLFLTYEENTFYVAEEKIHNDSIADTHPLPCEGCARSKIRSNEK